MLQTVEMYKELILLLDYISEQNEKLNALEQFDVLGALIDLQTATENLNFQLKALSQFRQQSTPIAGAPNLTLVQL